MLALKNISFGYSSNKLFTDVNLEIFPNDKIGLIGKNGSGKTTLLKILADEIKDYDGIKNISPNVTVGFLPQEVHILNEDFTPFSLCKKAFENIEEKIQRLEYLSHKLDIDKNQKEYDDLLHELSINNSFSYEHNIRIVLSNLGLSVRDMNTPFYNLSSGFKIRSYLGYLILISPDILMLDEPTNYLDIDAIKYLVDFLKSYQKSFIIISHDKNLLDEVTNKIWDLFAGKIYVYSNCNYSKFVERKQQWLENLEKSSKNIENKIKKQMEFINRFRAKDSKASLVQSRIKMIEKLNKIEIPQEQKIDFKINISNNTFLNILSCENIRFGYTEEDLLEDIHFSILRDDRIFLIGKNGIGKTTFLKLLVGQLKPKHGKVVIHNNAKVGYFEQNSTLKDSLNISVYDFFSESVDADHLTETERKNILGCFGFAKDDTEKTISILSGGEKVRLILAKIFISNPDILILDEPTTHLDIYTKEILIENLLSFNGAILAVSHDIDFIKNIATKFVTIENKRLKWFDNLEEYFESKAKDENISNKKGLKDKKVDNNKLEKSKISTNKRQQLKKQILEYEKQLLEIERKINEIEKKFEQNLSYTEINNINEAYKRLQKEYDEIFSKMVELEELIKK